MTALSPRDRGLILYVLWPAVLFAVLIWGIGPLAADLAGRRGLIQQRRSEITAMQQASTRSADVAVMLSRVRAQDAALRRRVITAGQAVNAVVSLQRLLVETGNTVTTVRVGDLERPRRADKPGSAVTLARIPVDITARGSYASLLRFLRRWSVASIPLKLVRVGASRTEESSAVEVTIGAAALLPAPPEENR